MVFPWPLITTFLLISFKLSVRLSTVNEPPIFITGELLANALFNNSLLVTDKFAKSILLTNLNS